MSHDDFCDHGDTYPNKAFKWCNSCKQNLPATREFWSMIRQRRVKTCHVCKEPYEFWRYYFEGYCRKCISKKQVERRQNKRFFTKHPDLKPITPEPCVICEARRTTKVDDNWLCSECNKLMAGTNVEEAQANLLSIQAHMVREAARIDYNNTLRQGQRQRVHEYEWPHATCIRLEHKYTKLYELLTEVK